jgi:hypothetical protein
LNDDELLRGLAAAIREEDRELAELEAEPIDERAAAKAAEALRSELGAARSGVVRRGPSARPLFLWIAPVVAVAAAVALGLWSRGRAPAPLPDYSLALLAGGAAGQRTLEPQANAEIRARAGGILDVVARPATRVDGPIDATAFLVHDGRASPWTATIETTPEGSARVRGVLPAETPLASGVWSLAVLIAPAGSLPGDPTKLAGAVEGGAVGQAWRIARARLVAQPTP